MRNYETNIDVKTGMNCNVAYSNCNVEVGLKLQRGSGIESIRGEKESRYGMGHVRYHTLPLLRDGLA